MHARDRQAARAPMNPDATVRSPLRGIVRSKWSKPPCRLSTTRILGEGVVHPPRTPQLAVDQAKSEQIELLERRKNGLNCAAIRIASSRCCYSRSRRFM